MNYSKKKNTYQAAMLVVSIVLLVSHLAIHRYFSFSEDGRMAAETEKISKEKKEIERLKVDLETRKSAESGRAAYIKKVMKVSAPFSALFIDSPKVRVGEILTEIQSLAKEAGVIFTRLDTENETAPWSKDLDKEVQINLGLKGDYAGVIKFLWLIRGSGWCFFVKSFDFTSRGIDTEAGISLGVAFAKS